MFSVVSVCGVGAFDCQCDNSVKQYDIYQLHHKIRREQDTAKRSDEFKNGCVPVHCSAQTVI